MIFDDENVLASVLRVTAERRLEVTRIGRSIRIPADAEIAAVGGCK